MTPGSGQGRRRSLGAWSLIALLTVGVVIIAMRGTSDGDRPVDGLPPGGEENDRVVLSGTTQSMGSGTARTTPETGEGVRATEAPGVLVLDETGLPLADAPVGLFRIRRLAGSAGKERLEAKTDELGVARFPGARESMTPYLEGPESSLWSFEVRCTLPFDEPPTGVPVDLSWFDAPRPTIEVPAVGWIRVVRDAAQPGSRPRARPVSLRWRKVEVASDGHRRLASGPVSWATFEEDANETWLGPVGLGWTVHVTGTDVGMAGAVFAEDVIGPTVTNRTVVVRMPSVEVIRVVGRATNPEGEPYANRNLLAEVLPTGEDKGGRRVGVSTDAGGRFQVLLTPGFAGEELVLSLISPRPKPKARLSLRGAHEGNGSVDAGTVVLEPEPLPGAIVLAEGRVVDAAERPVADARVSVYTKGTDGPYGRRRATARTRADGRFEILGDETHGGHELVLRVSSRNHVPAPPIPWLVGSAPVEIQLERGAGITADVFLDPTIPAEWISVELLSEGINRKRSLVEFRNRIAFWSLSGGDYSISVSLRNTDWELARRQVRISAGEEAKVDPIDLRGSVWVFETELWGPDATPLANTDLLALDLVGERSLSVRTDKDGWLRFLVPTEVRTLTLRAPGYLDIEVLQGHREDHVRFSQSDE